MRIAAMSEPNCAEQDIRDMTQLARGHDAALDALMERHAEKLFHYLVRSLQDESDAADLAQEAFVKVYQNRNKFDPNQKFTTWLYAIASNLVRDRFRWRSRHPQVSLEAENEQTEANLKDNLRAAELSPDQSLQTEERADALAQPIPALPRELHHPFIRSTSHYLPH